MTDREKLIALTMCHCALITEDACPKSSNGKCTIWDCGNCLADHLIANGVVVREKSEWELVEFQSSPLDTDQALVCTRCGFDHQYDDWLNFCPNCGSDMRVEEQNIIREGENG